MVKRSEPWLQEMPGFFQRKSGGAGPSPKVLVVDDEPDILESVSTLIESQLGLPVVSASSGKAALRVMRETPVGLIVSDYRMPGMDGCEFLEEAGKVAPGVPRVMISAYPDAALEKRAWSLGVKLFFAKPITPENFVTALRHALRPA